MRGWWRGGRDVLAGSAGAEEDDFREVVVHAAEFLGGGQWGVRGWGVVGGRERGGGFTDLVCVGPAGGIGGSSLSRHCEEVGRVGLVVVRGVEVGNFMGVEREGVVLGWRRAMVIIKVGVASHCGRCYRRSMLSPMRDDAVLYYLLHRLQHFYFLSSYQRTVVTLSMCRYFLNRH